MVWEWVLSADDCFLAVVDWMEADQNVSLQLIVRKGWYVSGLNDWKTKAYITREKSIRSLNLEKFNICMDESFKLLTCIYKIDGVNFQLMLTSNSTKKRRDFGPKTYSTQVCEHKQTL